MSATTTTDRKTTLAEERTATAHQRTRLAEERTYSAWARTGLAAVAAGFALVKLMPEAEPKWLIQCLGVLFIAAGGVMFVLGLWTYRRAIGAIPEATTAGAPAWLLGTITFALVVGAVAALVLVFTS